MGFNNQKRRGLKVSSVDEAAFDQSNVVATSEADLEKMTICFNGKLAYFRRLRYKGCLLGVN